ncbi:MAG: protoglobin family protein [Limisphaerales bacterium]
MKHIDEPRLETDLGYRFQYLTEFMGFTEEDIKAIHGGAALLAPLVPALVDAVYAKLISYDCTWRHFVPRQDGYTGQTPQNVSSLTMDHPQIQFRKQHLARYLEKLVTAPYDGKMVQYLDFVGKMHTPKAGNPAIDVPLVQMNALMGFVADAVNATILGSNLPADAKSSAVRAFSKLLWLQNDLINRHYAA